MLRKKTIRKASCLVCGVRFRPVRRWQKYCRQACNMTAYRYRTALLLEKAREAGLTV